MTEQSRTDFSRVVLAVMAAYDLKQTDIAEHMGLTQSQVSNKLAGKSAWTEVQIAQMARYLDPLPEQLYDLLRRTPARSLTVAYASHVLTGAATTGDAA